MSVDEITEANDGNRRPSACMPLINLEEMQSLRASDDSHGTSDGGQVSPKTLRDPPDLVIQQAEIASKHSSEN